MHHKLQIFPPKNDVQNTVALCPPIRCSRLASAWPRKFQVVGRRHHYAAEKRRQGFIRRSLWKTALRSKDRRGAFVAKTVWESFWEEPGRGRPEPR